MSRAARPPLRVAVLLSGEGTSLENLCKQIEQGRVPVQVALVLASKAGAGGLARAKRRGIPAVAVPRKEHPDVDDFNDHIHAALAEHDVDFVALLGFLSPFQLRERYAGRAINVHPALVPAFSGTGMYGARVHRAVLERGVKVSGATVHFVDAEYDHGPIILQQALPVREDDDEHSLAARVQAVERALVPEALRLIAEGRVRIEDGRTRIDEKAPPGGGGGGDDGG